MEPIPLGVDSGVSVVSIGFDGRKFDDPVSIE